MEGFLKKNQADRVGKLGKWGREIRKTILRDLRAISWRCKSYASQGGVGKQVFRDWC